MPEVLRVDDDGVIDTETMALHVPFTMNTSDITPTSHGLQLQREEEFVVAISANDEQPPTVYVNHFRFLGHPHVLSGYQFCLYLDPSREWDPEYGMNGRPNGVLNRLWRWLIKAAEGTFDPDAALYHAVGGLPHLSRASLTVKPIVVRNLPTPQGRVANAWLRHRSDWCLELDNASDDTDAENPIEPDPAKIGLRIPLFYPERDLPFGAGRDYLIELTTRIDYVPEAPAQLCRHQKPVRLRHVGIIDAARFRPHKSCGPACPPNPITVVARPRNASTSPATAMLTALTAAASRQPDGSPQILLIAVPHPQGGPRHLIACYFEPALTDHLRHLLRTRSTPLISFERAALDRSTPLKWCFVSDERPEVTTRRDTTRPVNAYNGKTVVVWGVGGIGSWVAEYVVRAGAKRVIVCDNGLVTGGLLVRQNYTDQDIGTSKADRLQARLASLTDTGHIESRHQVSDSDLHGLSITADVIIDATISKVVTKRLDRITQNPRRTAVIVQIATDTRTGTLGLAIVHGRGNTSSLTETDRKTGAVVLDDPTLEPYQVFWRDPDPGDEFVPTRGCSIPTFHGSAADLAGIAASLTTVVAPHLSDGSSGTYLLALPHSGVSPAYRYLAGRDASDLPPSVSSRRP